MDIFKTWDLKGVPKEVSIVYVAQDPSMNTLGHGQIKYQDEVVAEFDIYALDMLSNPELLVSRVGVLAKEYPQLRSLYYTPSHHLKNAIFDSEADVLIVEKTPETAQYTLIEWLKAVPLTKESAKTIISYALQLSQLYDQIRLLDPNNNLKCCAKLRVMVTDRETMMCYGYEVPTFGVEPFISSTHLIETDSDLESSSSQVSVLIYILNLACAEEIGHLFLKNVLKEIAVTKTFSIERLLQMFD